MSRAGRKRRSGRRHPNGRLALERGESPREIARRMPHRREFGEAALDQRAESSLGRLVLQKYITPDQWVAGQAFRRAWGVYLSTIGPPRAIGMAQFGGNGCEGCPVPVEPRNCLCAFRRAFYEHADRELRRVGFLPQHVVKLVALHDHVCAPAWVEVLRLGLDALVVHFGLTTKPTHCRNISF